MPREQGGTKCLCDRCVLLISLPPCISTEKKPLGQEHVPPYVSDY